VGGFAVSAAAPSRGGIALAAAPTRHSSSWKLLPVILLPLHGAVGYWDEIACLALPATVIMGVALALLRQEQKQGVEAHSEEDEADAMGDEEVRVAASARHDDDV
jgi:hypothetical protein